jgi:capsular polysaccharide biosynthesis protein
MTLDFWDLTKVLFRRWCIAIPLLVLTAGLTVLTFSTVKPDYVSTSYIQLVPPVPQPTKPNEPVVEHRNLWVGQGLETLGLQTLGNAVIVTILDQSVKDQMKSVGFSDSYTFEMGSTSPMVTVEVVAKSRPQAEGTANELVSRFNTSITSLQTAYGVTQPDLITARRLDLGNNVEKSSTNVKRALAAVFGAGLLLTIAATVGIDAWLRRRSGPSLSTIDVAAYDRAIGMAVGGLPEPTVGHPPRALVRSTKLGRATAVDEGSWYGKQPIVYQTATRAPAESLDDEQDYEIGEPDDATIVIPNFIPKNGAEIIPPPSEWLVNDRDSDA